ncbi:MAG: GNAT family N-acetyltransferase [Pseudomonadota bacterium]|nr:GNAT family N-acetyltransferase [Pseudomonadota bacterium]
MTNEVAFRHATRNDVSAIVALLADDELGRMRESNTDPLPESYYKSFELIDSDPLNELVVACSEDEVVGVFQLTFLPYLTHQGSLRALIEGVRVARSHRSQGLGQTMFEWAIRRARERGCRMMQLTTDKARPDAHRFYERLGFTASHEGMKLDLTEA